MGLDMYLEGRKYVTRNDYGAWDKNYDNPIPPNPMFGNVLEAAGVAGMDKDGHAGLHVSFPVGYWRKANAVHGWFVNEIANGVDECQPIWVSRERLAELKDLCEQVLADNSLAFDLLPPQMGFFFGSYDLDDWYLQDLQLTVEIIDHALSLPDDIDFIYQASW